MLYREIPFLQFTFALGSGIIAGNTISPSGICLYLAVTLFILLSVLLLFDRKKINSPRFGLVLSFLLFLSGISLYHSSMGRLVTLPAGSSEFVLIADDFPEEKEKTFSLPATIISCNGTSLKKYRNRIMAYFPDSAVSEIVPGNIITITLYPREITDFDATDNFDYQLYMNRKGFKYIAFTGYTYKIEPGRKTLKTQASNLKKHLLIRLSGAGLSDNNLAVTAALTLGQRDLMHSDVTENFRKAGITHILAVSGLHVGILSIILLSGLSFMRGRFDYLRVLLTICFIWMFALVTGLGPSVTRASLMFTFIYTGRLLQRPVNSINSLLASAFLILLLDPAMIFDVGFELSYSAVLFILLFYKDLYAIVPAKSKIISRIWAMIVVTILAQLGTLPFILFYFRTVPLLSIITNFIAIPSAFVILGGGLIIIVSYPLPIIPEISSKVVELTSSLLILVTEKISLIRFASITVETVTAQTFAALLIIIPVTTFYLLKRGSVHHHLLLSSIIIAVAISMI